MEIVKELFGIMPGGGKVYLFTLKNHNGMTAKISSFGAAVVSLMVPDKYGKFDDIVLGYDNLQGYLEGRFFFGATIGRNANRIRNSRIKINNKVYILNKNEGENQLHGGIKGFDKVLWLPKTYINNEKNQCIELSYLSRDGEEGYPGNLNVKVVYTLYSDNKLKIDYSAISDKDTLVNMTNHSYFNLSGHASGSILKHKVMINSDKFTVNDKSSIPTGEIRSVKGTPMDFTRLTRIDQNMDSSYDQIIFGNGYDHNWILNKSKNNMEKAVEVFDPYSGRFMKVYTTEPGMQFYTGNYINEFHNCKNNASYGKNSGLCLETQYFPDSLNHENFPMPILKSGEYYKQTTIYKFAIK